MRENGWEDSIGISLCTPSSSRSPRALRKPVVKSRKSREKKHVLKIRSTHFPLHKKGKKIFAESKEREGRGLCSVNLKEPGRIHTVRLD